MTPNNEVNEDLDRMKELEAERFRRRLLSVEKDAEQLRSRSKLLGIGFVLSLGLAALALLGQSRWMGGGGELEADVLRTGRVVLVGADGQPRGEWRVDEEGNSRLTILDRQGRTRLSLSVLNSGFPGLSLTNGNGQTRAALGLLPDESTSLVFADAQGVPRTVLGLSRADAAHLVFADAEGVSRVALGLDGSGEGSVILPEETLPEGSSGGGR